MWLQRRAGTKAKKTEKVSPIDIKLVHDAYESALTKYDSLGAWFSSGPCLIIFNDRVSHQPESRLASHLKSKT